MPQPFRNLPPQINSINLEQLQWDIRNIHQLVNKLNRSRSDLLEASVYENNQEAIDGGEEVGTLYRDASGTIKIVF